MPRRILPIDDPYMFESRSERSERLYREKEAKRQKEREYRSQMDALYEHQERQKEA